MSKNPREPVAVKALIAKHQKPPPPLPPIPRPPLPGVIPEQSLMERYRRRRES